MSDARDRDTGGQGKRCLILVGRQPMPGQVKTRLGEAIGEEQASELYEAFLRDTIHNCRRVDDCARCLSFTPALAEEYFARLDPEAILLPQPETDFGNRLRSAFEGAFARGFDRVVLIGSDTPHFGAPEIAAAFEVLEAESGIIGPCDDGGYYLLGLRSPEPALFERIDWSTDRVLQQTLDRARSKGLKLVLLPPAFDIDEYDDLQRLSLFLQSADPELCPLTALALAGLGPR